LQLFTPTHLTVAEPALSSARAVIAPLTMRSAAAPATMNDFAFILVHCLRLDRVTWMYNHDQGFIPGQFYRSRSRHAFDSAGAAIAHNHANEPISPAIVICPLHVITIL
jgi:hypothetical protein